MRQIQKNNWFLRLLFIVLTSGLLGSCSTKKGTTTDSKSFLSHTDMEWAVENTKWKGSFTSKAKFNIKFGTEHYALSGTLRVKRDEALQLSFQVPILGMEAVRLEVTPDRIVLIDRIHKKYVEESIRELSGLSNTGLDFYSIQSLFTGTVFRPGIKEFTLSDAAYMTFRNDEDKGVVELNNEERGLDYEFQMQTANDRLIQTNVRKPSTAYICNWEYSKHQEFAGHSFPMKINASMKGIPKEISLEIELSRFTSSEWEVNSSIPSRYDRIQLKDVMKMFSTL